MCDLDNCKWLGYNIIDIDVTFSTLDLNDDKSIGLLETYSPGVTFQF